MKKKVTKESLPEFAKEALADLLDCPGGILYSSHKTLSPGDVYLLGFNPGGAGGNPLQVNVDSLLSRSTNAYLDEAWENKNGEWGPGEAPLQKRVQWLLGELGQDTEAVCASNLIFLQSRAARDIDFALAEKCWPVHEAILEIVRPKLILTFGNSDVSPFGYLHRMFGGDIEYIQAGHGNWCAKGFPCKIDGRSVYVAGLPHLSRYSPIGKTKVVSWLAGKV